MVGERPNRRRTKGAKLKRRLAFRTDRAYRIDQSVVEGGRRGRIEASQKGGPAERGLSSVERRQAQTLGREMIRVPWQRWSSSSSGFDAATLKGDDGGVIESW